MYEDGSGLLAVVERLTAALGDAVELVRDGAVGRVALDAVPDLAVTLLRAQDTLAALGNDAVAVLDRAGLAKGQGFLSTRSFVADRTRWEKRRVAATVRIARRVRREYPATRDAWLCGAVTTGHVASITSGLHGVVAKLDPADRAAARAEVEPLLVRIATGHTPEVTDAAIARLRLAADPDGADAADMEADAQSWFRLNRVGDRWVPSGSLDDETGLAWNLILQGRRNTRFHTGQDTDAGQGSDESGVLGDVDLGDVDLDRDITRVDHRNAAVMGDLARELLDTGRAGTVGGERPHLEITVALTDLRSGIGCGDINGGLCGEVPIDLATVRRHSCDADVRRVVVADHPAHHDPVIARLLGARSEILDYGRSERIVPPGLRKRVERRDRCCIAPGCRRIPAHCQVHHVQSWLDGGETALQNLALLCPRHHRATHHEGWTAYATRGRLPHQHGYWTLHPPPRAQQRAA